MAACRMAFAAPTALLLCLLASASGRSLTQYGYGEPATPAPPEPPACPETVKKALASAETDADGYQIVWGTEESYATGTVRAYTKFNSSDPCTKGPSSVGLWISNTTMKNLPSPDDVKVQPPETCKGNWTAPGCYYPYDTMWLDWGDLEDYSPYKTMKFDWNPMGHPPPGIYDVPHFDFHFYFVGQDVVTNITAGPCASLSPEDYTAANQPIPASCYPGSNYTNMIVTVPAMGNHLLSTTSPEWNASMAGENATEAWNQTYIWGTYGGEITYMEPMIKYDYLMTKPTQCWEVPGMPSNFSIGGWRPKTYCVTSTDDAVTVEMKDFVWYESGCENEEEMAPESYGKLNPDAPPPPPECVLPEP